MSFVGTRITALLVRIQSDRLDSSDSSRGFRIKSHSTTVAIIVAAIGLVRIKRYRSAHPFNSLDSLKILLAPLLSLQSLRGSWLSLGLCAAPSVGMRALVQLTNMQMRNRNGHHICRRAPGLLAVTKLLISLITLTDVSKANGRMSCTSRPFGPTCAVPFPRRVTKIAEMALNGGPSPFLLQDNSRGVSGLIAIGTDKMQDSARNDSTDSVVEILRVGNDLNLVGLRVIGTILPNRLKSSPRRTALHRELSRFEGQISLFKISVVRRFKIVSKHKEP